MDSLPFNFEKVNNNNEKSLIQIYTDSVPYHPLATDILGTLRTYPKDISLGKSYIQHNKEGSISTLVIDVDSTPGRFFYEPLDFPHPNFAVMNKENYQYHLLYFIRNKVYKNKASNMKPFRFLSAIENALIEKVKGDKFYTQLISKNLLHERWERFFFHDYLFDLYDLAEDLIIKPRMFQEKTFFDFGLGRNCTTFDTLRYEAYKEFRDLDYSIGLDFFINHLWGVAVKKINSQFIIPLSDRELFAIAKSIGKWTWVHHTKNDFIAIQKRRGVKSGRVRAEKSSQLYQEIKKAKAENPLLSNRQLAALLGISKDTVRNALKIIKDTSDDSELFDIQPELF